MRYPSADPPLHGLGVHPYLPCQSLQFYALRGHGDPQSLVAFTCHLLSHLPSGTFGTDAKRPKRTTWEVGPSRMPEKPRSRVKLATRQQPSIPTKGSIKGIRAMSDASNRELTGDHRGHAGTVR